MEKTWGVYDQIGEGGEQSSIFYSGLDSKKNDVWICPLICSNMLRYITKNTHRSLHKIYKRVLQLTCNCEPIFMVTNL
jgi:hypothetical protein